MTAPNPHNAGPAAASDNASPAAPANAGAATVPDNASLAASSNASPATAPDNASPAASSNASPATAPDNASPAASSNVGPAIASLAAPGNAGPAAASDNASRAAPGNASPAAAPDSPASAATQPEGRRRVQQARGPEARRRVQRARDPEARRRALAAAALEVIAEAGIGRTTHRAVAARAGLPLGATTYYFPTLDDLIAAGLRKAAADLHDDLELWAARLRDTPDVPAALADLIAEYLADRRRAQIECELYVAAGRDAALRPLALAWVDGLRNLLTPHLGETAARDLIALIDGVMLQALITGAEVDAPALTATIRRLAAP
ncbi:hypothetical protein Ade02nite_25050 [Paractinoplanes deccanensis]|uniref:HTH tetR-type domain-containing protein n=2 Tax=Paractinoplanes deccanensis TaxID=113561 RepID=A0ABQ3Y1I2_9ACTN|nr:hypothetical protein Ade02nite_25050 [Actinoplanes deccanensis]